MGSAATAPAPVRYPAGRSVDVVLRDGSTVHVRPVKAEDEPALRALLEGLSTEARAFRFFSAGADLKRAAREAGDVDYAGRYGLVATSGAEDRAVGHAQYVAAGPARAEVAFAIADDFQGRGLGTILLAHLAEAAEEAGIDLLEAEVMPDNHAMVDVFRESGFAVQLRSKPGAIHVEFPSSLSEEAVERFERRDRVAAVAALRSFLQPASVAVIGASRRRGTVGGELFHNLLVGSFHGPVYPVNASGQVVQSVVAYRSVLEIPGEVELAVVVLPAEKVVEVARECAAKGVRALVVVSAGFAETGPEGAARQRELLTVCRGAGMRVIGPNCMGIVNTSPDVGLNATFAPVAPPRGRVGFVSQSGALGLAVVEQAEELGVGLSSFVSMGNKADISGNDLLQYWETDPDTDVILLYLESFGNPVKFSRIAKRVGRSKPIVAVKSGRSAAGMRGAGSHTGALIAASDVTVDALFRQAGVVRTETLAELFDVGSLLSSQPVPEGRRVAIVTNAGGLGIVCADACEAGGLEVAEMPERVRRALRAALPPEASVSNPVDLIATASADDYRRALEVIVRDRETDAVIAIFIPPLATAPADVARAIRDAAAAAPRELPLLAVFMGGRAEAAAVLHGGEPRVPAFSFPEQAARSLALAAEHADWRRRPDESPPELEGVRRDEASGVIARALESGGGWLEPDAVAELLDCYGLSPLESRTARSPAKAAAAAEELGGPVALKAVAADLVHKSDAGAVRLGLDGGRQVERAARSMGRSLRGAGYEVRGYLVQRMAPDGVEMLIGVVHDELFGPVVACGAGGVTAELVKDVAVRLTPLTERDARESIRSLATFPLLEGYRGAPAADVEALEQALLRVGAMADAHPEIAELDLNPVVVTPSAALVVDARVRIRPAAARPPIPSVGA